MEPKSLLTSTVPLVKAIIPKALKVVKPSGVPKKQVNSKSCQPKWKEKRCQRMLISPRTNLAHLKNPPPWLSNKQSPKQHKKIKKLEVKIRWSQK
ncbi:hypothetical protein O181_116841 [Austropuccinia psidii MF-1]|uniref:Uncharacterized protein n=1 Tax=Austropuccinia psidii MF-1 TaxID=1389203 RepID=A0A9Q3KAU4_9BASI|nr:hypothetical protein [Austropuccinia psidii MF-1]